MKQYTIIIEQAPNNYSAYVSNPPRCVTTGSSIDEPVENMKEAISLHLETMAKLGIPIPEPDSVPTQIPDRAVTRHVGIAA